VEAILRHGRGKSAKRVFALVVPAITPFLRQAGEDVEPVTSATGAGMATVAGLA